MDPLFVAATSFIARDFGRRPERVRKMAWLLMVLAMGVGVVIAGLSFAISTYGPGVFTEDVVRVGAFTKSRTPCLPIFVPEGTITSADCPPVITQATLRMTDTFFLQPQLIQTAIRGVGPLMAASQLVSALVLVTEGVLIGCGDLRYLLNVHCLNFVCLAGVLWWVGKSSLGLNGIWIGVFLNQSLRMVQHAAHMAKGGGPDLFGNKSLAKK